MTGQPSASDTGAITPLTPLLAGYWVSIREIWVSVGLTHEEEEDVHYLFFFFVF